MTPPARRSSADPDSETSASKTPLSKTPRSEARSRRRIKVDLSPREFARALEVSESSVKRWVDSGKISATKTAGGHRRILITEAIRYVREHGIEVAHPEILGFAMSDGERVEAGVELERLLRAGSADESRALLASLFLAGMSVDEICDGPLGTAMRSIGALYRTLGNEGILIEHRATEIVSSCLRAIIDWLPESADGPVAIGGAAPGDHHLLPSMSVGAVLRSEGYRSISLGANLPFDSLRAAIPAYSPRIVWLSVSHPVDAPGLARGISELVSDVAPLGGFVAVGGGAIEDASVAAHPRLFRASRLGDLVGFARRCLVGPA